MASSYQELLLETKPQVIENREQYEEILRRASGLIRLGRKRSSEETKLMRLLSVLIQDYDRRKALPAENTTPAERLQHLLEISGRTHADLLPNLRPTKSRK